MHMHTVSVDRTFHVTKARRFRATAFRFYAYCMYCKKHLEKRVAACSEWRKVVVVLVEIRIVVYHSYSPLYGYVEALPSLSLRFGVL
jgi:hypothetical protein